MAEEPQTLHHRILSDLQDNILSGLWPPGHRIPFETDLAAQYQCSRMTANKVLGQLARDGLIERRRKSGSFVIRPHTQSAVLEISDIKSEVASLGLSYQYQLVSRQRRKANGEDRQRLGLVVSTPVLALEALHFAGKKPFCLEDRLINLKAVPEAEQASFESEPPSPWLIRRVPWSAAEHTIRALGASARMAEMLKAPVGTACLVVERRTLWQEEYLTQVRLSYIGASHALTARFTPSQKV